MCGIAGVFYLDKEKAVDHTVLKSMCDVLAHRGPDEEGFYCQENIGLAHRRLNIIDLNTGQQPMYNENRNIVVVFNGEIYNFLDLKKELCALGHTFQTRSDTETIVHAYEEWGTDLFKHLRGMFAFAVLDRKNRCILLGRDRLGKKPLYFYQDKDKILFASEIKAILQHPEINRDIDGEAVKDYFILGYIPGEKSIFKSVRKLKAGHFALISPNGISIREYWDIVFTGSTTDVKRAKENILNKLDEAVRIRLMSDVPLGAFLSGGIDSSAVVAMMSKNSKERIITSSIGFKEAGYDELVFSRQAADMFKCSYHEYTVRPDIISTLEKLIWHYDEPFGDSSCIPTYHVSKTARRNVKVALSGDGGDENFAGYNRYRTEAGTENIRNRIPGFLKMSLLRRAQSLYPRPGLLPGFFKGRTTIKNLSMDFEHSYFNSINLLRNGMEEDFFSRDYIQSLNNYDTYSVFEGHYSKVQGLDTLSRMQYVDIKTYLADDILVKVDRASMAVSLEVRCPLLDHKFMEYAASLSGGMKLQGKKGKYVFKEALSGILPQNIIHRDKTGFALPVKEWITKDIKDYAADIIFKDNRLSDYIDMANFKNMWDGHQKGAIDHSRNIWNVLIFALWRNRFQG
jgi:asparagine synthase (glutamine-hydrolysing)